MRILLIEDDEQLGQAIQQALRDNAMAVDWIQDGHPAVAALEVETYSMLLPDLGLPKKDGLTVLAELRQQRPELPVGNSQT